LLCFLFSVFASTQKSIERFVLQVRESHAKSDRRNERNSHDGDQQLFMIGFALDLNSPPQPKTSSDEKKSSNLMILEISTKNHLTWSWLLSSPANDCMQIGKRSDRHERNIESWLGISSPPPRNLSG
jgi:hypothetical protein